MRREKWGRPLSQGRDLWAMVRALGLLSIYYIPSAMQLDVAGELKLR